MAHKTPYQKMMARNKLNNEGDKLDFFETPPEATHALMQRESFAKKIWEPACGMGAISNILGDDPYWKEVYSSDIVNRGWEDQDEECDFLLETEFWQGDIITNPPFVYAEDFLHQAMRLIPIGGKVALLLRLMWLESKGRYERVYSVIPPKTVYVFSNRLKFVMPDGKRKSGMVPYAWFIWEKGVQKRTEIQWLLA